MDLNKQTGGRIQLPRLSEINNPAIQNVLHYVFGGGKPATRTFPEPVIHAAIDTAEQHLLGGGIASTPAHASRYMLPGYDPIKAGRGPSIELPDKSWGTPAEYLARNTQFKGHEPSLIGNLFADHEANAFADLIQLDPKLDPNNPHIRIHSTGPEKVDMELLKAGMESRLFYNTFGGYGVEYMPNGTARVADSFRFYPHFGNPEAGKDLVGSLFEGDHAKRILSSPDTSPTEKLYELGTSLVGTDFEATLAEHGKPFPLYSNAVPAKVPPTLKAHLESLGLHGWWDAQAVANPANLMALAIPSEVAFPLFGAANILHDTVPPAEQSAQRMVGNFTGATPLLENQPMASGAASGLAGILGSLAKLDQMPLEQGLLGVQDAGYRALGKIGRGFEQSPLTSLLTLAGLAPAASLMARRKPAMMSAH